MGCESQILAKEYEGKLDSERKYSSFFEEYYGGIKTNIERFRNNLSWINKSL